MTLLRLIFGGLVCWRRGHALSDYTGTPMSYLNEMWRRCPRCYRWVRP